MALRAGIIRAILALLPGVLAAGCNIFGFVSDDESSPVEAAERAIRDGDYARAKRELTDAHGALRDSSDSMVRYTYSKAALLESGLSIATIADLIQADRGTTPSGGLALLEEVDRLDFATQTAWYRANREVVANLAPIWNAQTRGELTRDDIAFDYTVAAIMSGVLGFRDTNRDLRIDSGDLLFRFSRVSRTIDGRTVTGFDFTGVAIRDEQGSIIAEFDGLGAFLGASRSGAAATVRSADGYTPDSVNLIIADPMKYLAEGDDGIAYLLADRREYTSFDLNEIREYLLDVARLVNFYWYDDGIDDDGDGRTDEEAMNGADDDGDGFIDEDTRFMTGFDATDVRNTQYIPLWERWRNR